MKSFLNKVSSLVIAAALITGISIPAHTTTVVAKTASRVQQGVQIISVTSPAARNSNATLRAKVAPGASASIVVIYKSGPSTAKGLGTKKADSKGNVSWTWRVGGRTTLGDWPITVTSNGKSVTTTFTVVH